MAAGRGGRRRLIGAAVVLVLVPVVLVTAARRLVPREQVAARLAALVAERTGAEYEPGTSHLVLGGGPGVALENGSLRGTGAELARRTGVENSVERYALEYDRLEVRLGLAALLSGRVEVKGAHLQAPRLVLDIGGASLALRDLDLQVTDFMATPGSAAGAASGLPTDGPLADWPPDLTFRLQLAVAEFDHAGCPWRDVALDGTWSARSSDDIRLEAALGDGRLAADLALDFGAHPAGRLDGSLMLDDVPSALVLAPYLPDIAGRLRTALDGEVRGGLELDDAATRLATLDLTGRLSGGAGTLDARDWLREVEPYLGTRRDLVTVRFDRLDHRFAVRQETYFVEQLELDGPDTDWQASGRVAFTGAMALAVGVRLPQGFTPDLGALSFLAESLRDDEGRVTLGLKVTGQTAAPVLGLDLARRR